MNEENPAWRTYVEQYSIEVPKERVQSEIEYFTAQLRHCLRYDTLTGGSPHPFPGLELAEKQDEIREAAYFEAKSALVLKELLEKHPVAVTPEELAKAAEAMAARQNTSIELIRRFFGKDLSGLDRDIKERKVIEWACQQETAE